MTGHPIEELMRTTMDSIKDMIDVNTIVGNPVHTENGAVIIPISKVSIGFASGGSEFDCRENKNEAASKFPFGGGSGAGMSLNPVAFLVVSGSDVRLLTLCEGSSVERLVERIPSLIDDVVTIAKNNKGQFKNQSNKQQTTADVNMTNVGI